MGIWDWISNSGPARFLNGVAFGATYGLGATTDQAEFYGVSRSGWDRAGTEIGMMGNMAVGQLNAGGALLATGVSNIAGGITNGARSIYDTLTAPMPWDKPMPPTPTIYPNPPTSPETGDRTMGSNPEYGYTDGNNPYVGTAGSPSSDYGSLGYTDGNNPYGGTAGSPSSDYGSLGYTDGNNPYGGENKNSYGGSLYGDSYDSGGNGSGGDVEGEYASDGDYTY